VSNAPRGRCACAYVYVCAPKWAKLCCRPPLRSHSNTFHQPPSPHLDPVLTALLRFRVGNKVSESSDPRRNISRYICMYILLSTYTTVGANIIQLPTGVCHPCQLEFAEYSYLGSPICFHSNAIYIYIFHVFVPIS